MSVYVFQCMIKLRFALKHLKDDDITKNLIDSHYELHHSNVSYQNNTDIIKSSKWKAHECRCSTISSLLLLWWLYFKTLRRKRGSFDAPCTFKKVTFLVSTFTTQRCFLFNQWATLEVIFFKASSQIQSKGNTLVVLDLR